MLGSLARRSLGSVRTVVPLTAGAVSTVAADLPFTRLTLCGLRPSSAAIARTYAFSRSRSAMWIRSSTRRHWELLSRCWVCEGRMACQDAVGSGASPESGRCGRADGSGDVVPVGEAGGHIGSVVGGATSGMRSGSARTWPGMATRGQPLCPHPRWARTAVRFFRGRLSLTGDSGALLEVADTQILFDLAYPPPPLAGDGTRVSLRLMRSIIAPRITASERRGWAP